MQYNLSPSDLEIVLALVRGRTLANAGSRLDIDASTVFRSLQKMERGLGQTLFQRSRTGYLPTEQALQLARHAEEIETALAAARSNIQAAPAEVSGSVSITTTDSILHGLLAPALHSLQASHPLLNFDLDIRNELANLAQRDADIALRATQRPPQHLVGKRLGILHGALYVPRSYGPISLQELETRQVSWIGTDGALQEHPSVIWRKRHYPKVTPRYRVSSIVSVLEMIREGLGIGLLPIFLGDKYPDVIRVTAPLADYQSELWLLTHPESRHLRRIAVAYNYLADNIILQ
ncbi:DNA-binding transcriptional LysR family regulator [Chitinivorax tropicus]|uniref:DNA-binding transcriptional LysR family regulator n=1 Tax=Chitinivorax tropicus TaxID=714531 RepID=A0A840MSQ9_9PROT|nr:LysR family transcriptional regulator [Chitinivorax tropicus]MBB5019313.1 DNA-binding transcriptional LysR family regulator [Chitinivorax tropicus]